MCYLNRVFSRLLELKGTSTWLIISNCIVVLVMKILNVNFNAPTSETHDEKLYPVLSCLVLLKLINVIRSSMHLTSFTQVTIVEGIVKIVEPRHF